MKTIDIRELAQNSPDFRCLSGSRLYGTNTETSDWDFRGFIFPPFEYLIGVKNFDCVELEGDSKIHNVSQFLKLILRGDPQCTELLFASPEHISILTETGQAILDLKDHLLSMSIFGRILGYSAGEWRKCMALKIVSKERSREKHDVISDIRTFWHPDKENMDEICRILDSFDEKTIVSSFSGVGQKRKQDIEEFGFCRKSAAHSIRLLGQLIEIMDTGKMTFPRPNASLLLDIRNGKYKKEDLQIMYDDLVHEAEDKKEKSCLPYKPNEKRVWEVYTELTATKLVNDERLKDFAS